LRAPRWARRSSRSTDRRPVHEKGLVPTRPFLFEDPPLPSLTAQRVPLLAGLLIAACAVLVYLPGLPGGFIFDDIHNIADNRLLFDVVNDIEPWTRLLDSAFG